MSFIVAGLSINVAVAFNGVGNALNTQCTNDGRIPATPYTPGNCTLCHTGGASGGPGVGRTAWNKKNWDFFCLLPQVNTPPVAAAGPDQSVIQNDLVALNGGASSDADGDPLTYLWMFSSVPAGSSAALSNDTASMPTFTADSIGTYVVDLVVNDGTDNSVVDSCTITVGPGNTAPVANAGTPQTVNQGDLVTLDGSGSSDANSDPLTFSWMFTSIPAGSSATLSSSTASMPTFTADIAGNYVVQLIVNDGTDNSAADTVTVTTNLVNTAPLSNAGLDQAATVNDVIMLDGSGSSDADGDSLTYSWAFVSLPPSSVAFLSNTAAAMPSFTADVPGDYVIQLIVNDGTVDGAPDTVTVKVGAAAGNTAPVAVAGMDQSVTSGITVNLDGNGSSDADGDSLTYLWAFVSKPATSGASLSSANTAMPWFVADVPGDYIVQLIVNDGTIDSTPDTVTIRAGVVVNTAPVASAGMDQNAKPSDNVMLDGSGSSDAEGDTLTYLWTLTSIPAGSNAALSDSTAVNPSIVPDIVGQYVVQLIVNDGEYDSSPDSMVINVNDQPIATPNIRLGLRVGPPKLKLKEEKLGRKAFRIVVRVKHKKAKYRKGYRKEGRQDNVVIPVLVDVILTKPDGTMETLVQQHQALKKYSKLKLKYYPTMEGKYKVKVVVTDEAGDVLKSRRRSVWVIVKDRDHDEDDDHDDEDDDDHDDDDDHKKRGGDDD